MSQSSLSMSRETSVDEFFGEWAEPIFYSGLLWITLQACHCLRIGGRSLISGHWRRRTRETGGYLIFTREPVNPLYLLVFLMILGVSLPVRKWATREGFD